MPGIYRTPFRTARRRPSCHRRWPVTSCLTTTFFWSWHPLHRTRPQSRPTLQWQSLFRGLPQLWYQPLLREDPRISPSNSPPSGMTEDLHLLPGVTGAPHPLQSQAKVVSPALRAVQEASLRGVDPLLGALAVRAGAAPATGHSRRRSIFENRSCHLARTR